MRERFEGEGHKNLMNSLLSQEFVSGNLDLANAFAKVGCLVPFKRGDHCITEGGVDNDVFLLVAGSVKIIVKGCEIAIRKAGQHVGEMAAIEAVSIVLCKRVLLG